MYLLVKREREREKEQAGAWNDIGTHPRRHVTVAADELGASGAAVAEEPAELAGKSALPVPFCAHDAEVPAQRVRPHESRQRRAELPARPGEHAGGPCRRLKPRPGRGEHHQLAVAQGVGGAAAACPGSAIACPCYGRTLGVRTHLCTGG